MNTFKFDPDNERIVLFDADNNDIAEVFHSGLHTVPQSHAEAQANARLFIAAGPMLAALEAFIEPFSDVTDEVLRAYPDVPQPRNILAARAAIKLVRGE